VIERNWPDTGYVVHCDYCSEDLEIVYARDFMDAVHRSKSAGWRPVMVDGEWRNRCPACCQAKDPAGDRGGARVRP